MFPFGYPDRNAISAIRWGVFFFLSHFRWSGGRERASIGCKVLIFSLRCCPEEFPQRDLAVRWRYLLKRLDRNATIFEVRNMVGGSASGGREEDRGGDEGFTMVYPDNFSFKWDVYVNVSKYECTHALSFLCDIACLVAELQPGADMIDYVKRVSLCTLLSAGVFPACFRRTLD